MWRNENIDLYSDSIRISDLILDAKALSIGALLITGSISAGRTYNSINTRATNTFSDG